jgi:hypothetical protein
MNRQSNPFGPFKDDEARKVVVIWREKRLLFESVIKWASLALIAYSPNIDGSSLIELLRSIAAQHL